MEGALGKLLDRQALRLATSSSEAGILDGRLVAAEVRRQVQLVVSRLRGLGHSVRLSVVRVGDDPASAIYVRHKQRDCAAVGIASEEVHLPDDATFERVLDTLASLNDRDDVDGVLLQLPLPAHIDPQRAISSIAAAKDVDGFHPDNLGQLMAWASAVEPATPRGVMTLLRAYDVELSGLDAVVIGRSMIVGRPMAQMLTRANATVTVCHRHTTGLEHYVRRAGLVVAATGVSGLVPGDWIREGAVVVDVGISRGQDGKLRGDVDFADARSRARLITPVPGGVGPMTRASLLENTVVAAARRRGISLRHDAHV